MISVGDIHRLYLGHFTAPPEDHRSGQKIFVCAYLIEHPDGPILVDTGIGEGHEEAERRYRPVRRPLAAELARMGRSLGDIRVVLNCHLHFDHSGGNPLFPGTPILAQRLELEAAHAPDYTLPMVVDFTGARYVLYDGEADVAADVRIVPTPGHTEGHQSVVVGTREGTVVIAGQAYNSASEYARAQYALELERTGSADRGPYLGWVARIQELDPWRVLFAHDVTIWERDARPVGGAIGPNSPETRR